MTKIRFKKTTCFLFIILTITLLDLCYFFLMPLAMISPDLRPASEQLPRTAAILFHEFTDSYTNISPETERRVNLGVSLFEQGAIDTIIFAGGHRLDGKAIGSHLMQAYALTKGLPADIILTAGPSHDSLGNIATIKELLVEPNQPIRIISSPYHLYRLNIIADDILENIVLYPYDLENCTPPASRRDIWLSAHYNFTALALDFLLPDKAYRETVNFIRSHTDF